jgi:hypothetical protein
MNEMKESELPQSTKLKNKQMIKDYLSVNLKRSKSQNINSKDVYRFEI